MVLVAIWADLPGRAHRGFYKATSVACVMAVAVPQIALLSLARMRRQYGWVRWVTVMLATILGGLISYMIITGDDQEPWLRLMGILAIGDVCGTIAVPILHRISAIRAREEVRTVELLLSLTCPRCDKTQKLPVGRTKCSGCGLRLSIDIEEEQCEHCGYPLYRLTSAVCPECGTPIARDLTDPQSDTERA